MSKKKIKVWIVTGHNGSGKDLYEPTILGFYANKHTAEYLITELQDRGEPWEHLNIHSIMTGSSGVDLKIKFE
jgi:hypothetical protein